MKATITAAAFNAKTKEPIKDILSVDITATIECSTDIPAEYLGEVSAEVMHRAWRTGIDGTDIELRITFN